MISKYTKKKGRWNDKYSFTILCEETRNKINIPK